MVQPRINDSQIKKILSEKVVFEEFDVSKQYQPSIIVKYNGDLYLSLTDISAGEFNPLQWKKLAYGDNVDIKQDKITSIGVDNLLTAPASVGGQPGKLPISSLEPAFEILGKEKGGTGSDLTSILNPDNANSILKVDTNGDISAHSTIGRDNLNDSVNASLDLADTSIQPGVLQETVDNIINTINTHIEDKSNPHSVTKAQVGLGNVDNTSDNDKPISEATQNALSAETEARIAADIEETNARIAADQAEMEARQADISQVQASVEEHNRVVNQQISELDEAKADKATTLSGYNITDAYTKDETNNLLDLKANESEVNAALDTKLNITDAENTYATITNVNNHINDVNNPHSVTKAQVGLGNVDNTSDANKPISTATQAALDLKANNTDLSAHVNNKNNPHAVTKAQVGLGNVDNTSDIDKPISTATQTALDDKVSFSDYATSTGAGIVKVGAGLTAVDGTIQVAYASEAQIAEKQAYRNPITPRFLDYAIEQGLGNNKLTWTEEEKQSARTTIGLSEIDNTSDANKPISTATQAALDLKANESDVNSALDTKQDNLVSGTNIKTINNESLLGSTDIQLQTKLSGTSGNVVTYTATTGVLGELGFDSIPQSNSNKLLTSGVIYNELLKKINYTDIVNDVTTGGTNKPLSAEQGKYLDSRITEAMQSTHDRGVVLNALTSQGQNYSIVSATVLNGGSGYTQGDALFLISETLHVDAILIVDGVSSSGAVTGITISKGGAFAVNPTGSNIPLDGGTGTGATFNITAELKDNVILADISNPQPNDFATVLQDELHDGIIYVWKYADFNGDGTYNWVSGYPGQADQRDFYQNPIQAGELGTNSVTTAKIVDGNVTLGKLAENSVDGTKIIDGSITNEHVSETANITQSKIAGLVDALNSKANSADVYKKTETYNQTEIDTKLNAKLDSTTASATYATITNLNSHVNNKSNPHSVTKAQVGLGNVDNTSDANKPISTATQAALDLKANQDTTYTKDEVDQIVEEAKPNINGAASTIVNDNLTPNRVVISNVDGKIDDSSISTTELSYLSGATSNIQTQITTLDGSKQDNLTAGDGIKIENNVISNTQTSAEWGNIQGDITLQTDLQDALGLKANTTDVNSELAKKLNITDAQSTYATITNLNNHVNNKSNPHSVTKAQVGLGNVDNTSDTDKPISSATQSALDLKADKSTTYTKTDVDSLLNTKANTTDVYTKTQANDLLAAKANSADVYSKTDANNKFASKDTSFITPLTDTNKGVTKTDLTNETAKYLPLTGGNLTGSLTGQDITGTTLTSSNLQDMSVSGTFNIAVSNSTGTFYKMSKTNFMTSLDLATKTEVNQKSSITIREWNE